MNGASPIFDVSRETQEKLQGFEALVRKWNPKINLVANSTLSQFSTRHVHDGIAVSGATGAVGDWLDIGSGGGFPGIIVSILSGDERHVTLVESDSRKCAFLSTVRRELGLQLTVINERIEEMKARSFPVISARALAPLPRLLDLAHRFGDPASVFLFPKGQNWEAEHVAAQALWRYDMQAIESATTAGSVILKIKNIERAEA